MKLETTRRDILKGSLALAGLGVIGVPEWAMPILAADESVVQFTDIPENVRWDTPPDRRMLDVRTIDGPFTAVELSTRRSSSSAAGAGEAAAGLKAPVGESWDRPRTGAFGIFGGLNAFDR